MMLIACGMLPLSLVQWQGGRLCRSRRRADYWLCGTGLAVGAIATGVYLLQGAAEFGPAIAAEAARSLPEFRYPAGRVHFFTQNHLFFWVDAPRSGFVPTRGWLAPPILVMALCFPILVRWPRAFPLAQRFVSTGVLLRMWLVSAGFFAAAHALLFRLHLPSRYTQHTIRIWTILAASVAVVLLLDALRRCVSRQPQWWRSLVLWLAAIAIAIATFTLPLTIALRPAIPALGSVKTFSGYVSGRHPELYQFFRQQPKDSLVASLEGEVANLPLLAQRAALVSKEHAIPYHLGYYRAFRQRFRDSIEAQYSPELAVVRHFTQQYQIDFWLLSRESFTPKYLQGTWLRHHYPAASERAAQQLAGPEQPIVQQAIPHCRRYQKSGLIVLDAPCVAAGAWQANRAPEQPEAAGVQSTGDRPSDEGASDIKPE